MPMLKQQLVSELRRYILPVKKGHMDIVQYLITEGHADVEATTNRWYTSLDVADYFGHEDVVQYFIKDCHAHVGGLTKKVVRLIRKVTWNWSNQYCIRR